MQGANFRDLPGVIVGADNAARRDETKEHLLPSGEPLVSNFFPRNFSIETILALALSPFLADACQFSSLSKRTQVCHVPRRGHTGPFGFLFFEASLWREKCYARRQLNI